MTVLSSLREKDTLIELNKASYAIEDFYHCCHYLPLVTEKNVCCRSRDLQDVLVDSLFWFLSGRIDRYRTGAFI